ncbi:MAG: GspE/PulE family protein, partial [Gaiellaceae bacterium]
MDLKRPNKLRLSGRSGEADAPPAGDSGLGAPFAVNEVAELVADLIEATGLVSRDRLAAVRGRVKQGGSFAQAVLDEGVATSEGLARTLASRYQLPLVELPLVGVTQEAAEQIPVHVLERVIAVPYALDGNTLRIAIADPGNVHAIDELRLATRYTLELGVASREDIEGEIKRLARASEAFGARSAIDEEEGFLGEEEQATQEDDLEVDDGISDVPLVRLVNSIIFQAAEDGASDIHFEPQEDALAVRLRIDGVLHEVQRIPKRMMPGVTTRLKVLAKLDIAERRKPQDGRIALTAAAAGRMMDIRVAVLPTVEGESIVMRLVDKSKK